MNYHYENIENYLNDRLPEEERIKFEKAMSEDPDLKEAVENHDIARMIFDGLEEEDIRDQVEIIKQKTTAKSVRLWWRSIAAGAVLLLGLVWWMSRDAGLSSDQLFAKVYERDSQFESSRSGEVDDLIRAFNALDAGDEDLALTLIKSEDSERAKFAEGLYYLETGDVNLAISKFSELIDSGYEKAYFYRGLAYLKLRDKELARKDFEIARGQGDKRVDYYNLLKKLK